MALHESTQRENAALDGDALMTALGKPDQLPIDMYQAKARRFRNAKPGAVVAFNSLEPVNVRASMLAEGMDSNVKRHLAQQPRNGAGRANSSEFAVMHPTHIRAPLEGKKGRGKFVEIGQQQLEEEEEENPGGRQPSDEDSVESSESPKKEGSSPEVPPSSRTEYSHGDESEGEAENSDEDSRD